MLLLCDLCVGFCLAVGGLGITYNLGQNEWNISTTPPPYFNDAKKAGFGLCAPSSLPILEGRRGRGLNVPFILSKIVR